jgi:hypothetical protein
MRVRSGRRFQRRLLRLLSAVLRRYQGACFFCPVTLEWDASPDASVEGYVLYYGVENSNTTNRLEVGPAQSVALTNLYAHSNYFFFATAYNTLGVESVPSGSLFYRPPAITRLRLTKQADGVSILLFRSAPASLCRVEYALTPDSNQWLTLATTNADVAGKVVIYDSTDILSEKRFYRAVRVGTTSDPQ